MTSGASTILLALESAGAVQILALRPESAFEVDDVPSGRTSLTVLLYAESLEALGLQPGEQALLPPTACGARELPEGASGVFTGELDGDDRSFSGWTEPAALPAAVNAAHIQGPCPCSRLRVANELPLHLSFWPVVNLPEGVLGQLRVGTATLSVVLGPDGLDEVQLMNPPIKIRTGYRADDGELWLVERGGGVWHGRLGQSFVRTATIPGRGVEAVDGARGASPPELWALSETYRVFRRRSEAWEEMTYPALPIRGSRQTSTLLWLGSGSAIAAPADAAFTVHFDEATSPRIVPFAPDGRGYRSFATVEDLGVVGADQSGYLFSLARDGWELLPGASSGAPSHDLQPFPGGFFYLKGGELHQYIVRERRSCEPLPLGALTPLWLGRVEDGRLLVVSEAQGGKIATVVE
ncbi:MAG: hypothetical protein IT384_25885 [Deltaproteobacteria bacterium]|nr:hypothetical protein [Deltaproteobacteria bacterium]